MRLLCRKTARSVLSASLHVHADFGKRRGFRRETQLSALDSALVSEGIPDLIRECGR